MRQVNPRGVTGRLVGVKSKSVTGIDPHFLVGESADADFWSLQIGKNADRTSDFFLNSTNGAMQGFQQLVRGVAHVDAEDIDTGDEKLFDHFRAGRRRPQGCQDFDFAFAMHVQGPCVVLSPDKVIVQSVSSPVSTSEKPTLLYPRS